MNRLTCAEQREFARANCLKLGKKREVEIPFNSPWCREYFKLSGDINDDLHGDDGDFCWAQGTGTITLIGAMMSIHMPDFIAMKLEISFRSPINIGHTVLMTMHWVKEKGGIAIVEVELARMDGTIAADGKVILGPKPKKP